jgi:hypothetical protein
MYKTGKCERHGGKINIKRLLQKSQIVIPNEGEESLCPIDYKRFLVSLEMTNWPISGLLQEPHEI